VKKKIFLTGANGFIGKNILEGLSQKYNFFAPSHKQLDILDFYAVQKYYDKNGPFDTVLHTAIIGGNRKIGDSKEYAMDSLRMFFNLTSNNKFFKRFFYFGSGIEYGKESPIKNYRETDFGKRIPQSNWGLYKYACAKAVENTDNFINFRLFGVFGKYEDWRIRFISNAICKSIFNLPITINQNIIMDYLYVEDLVKILDFFLKKRSKFKVYNVTSGKGIDLLTLAIKINSIANKKVKIIIKREGIGNEYTGNNQRLVSEFKGFEFTGINVAILQLYRWYLKKRNKIRREDLLEDYF